MPPICLPIHPGEFSTWKRQVEEGREGGAGRADCSEGQEEKESTGGLHVYSQ